MFSLRKLGFWCLACEIALEFVWVPTLANPADAPSWNKPINNWYASALSDRGLRRQSTPLRKLICSVNRCQPRGIQPVSMCESSWSSNCSRAGRVCGENDASQSCVGSSVFHCLQVSSECLLKKVNNSRCFEETQNQKDGASDWPCRRAHLHYSELVQCAAWARLAHAFATRQLAKRIVVSCR